tara:strand:+ start:6609 stop:7472 length:864 start_codon:yes stop_codon:yes gene_type:complete
MTRNWHTLTLQASAEVAEVLSALCFSLGSCGLQTDDRGSDVQLTVYFPEALDLEDIQDALQSFAKDQALSDFNVSRSLLGEEDWEAEWRRFFRPIWATPNVVIHPSWIPVEAGDGLAITIDPKMAFGTGGHESTQLCLQALEQYVERDYRVLDLGTGSGVLSIAAVRWGAAHVTSLDVDSAAVENARENIELNRVDKNRVDVRVGCIDDCREDAAFDLIVANIQSRILLPILAPLRDRLLLGQPVIFSGILGREKEAFCRALSAHGFELVEVLTKNEWIGIVARRGS